VLCDSDLWSYVSSVLTDFYRHSVQYSNSAKDVFFGAKETVYDMKDGSQRGYNEGKPAGIGRDRGRNAIEEGRSEEYSMRR